RGAGATVASPPAVFALWVLEAGDVFGRRHMYLKAVRFGSLYSFGRLISEEVCSVGRLRAFLNQLLAAFRGFHSGSNPL
ncbi:MAG: hypothetical protein AAGB46_12885, partial [Verrucomicrobiota bacterium]